MEIFVNDLSFHGSFRTRAAFHDAFAQVMAMRETAKRFGRNCTAGRTLLARRDADAGHENAAGAAKFGHMTSGGP